MSHNPAIEIASVIQSASIKRHPSPHHDVNPSTAASAKVPATLVHTDEAEHHHHQPHSPGGRSHSSSSSISTIPSDILRPRPRKKSFPPLPDLRFEQSYLASLNNAQTNWQVAFITLRDQVMLPLVQGIMWNMLISGWRHWNRGAQFKGQGLGSRIRKWWWGVNNWKLPEAVQTGGRRADFASGAEEFYVEKFGSSMGD